MVVLYTDGVTDAIDAKNEPFGEDRSRRTLAGAQPAAATDGEAILAAVGKFAQGPTQFDDATIV